jgi:hypothetical protein
MQRCYFDVDAGGAAYAPDEELMRDVSSPRSDNGGGGGNV